MARLILFLCAVALFPLLIMGQVSVSVDPLNFVLTGRPTDTDLHYYIHVQNNGNDTARVFWSKRMSNQPAPWTTWICDMELCWDPDLNSCLPNYPNRLGPGDTFNLEVHMNPNLTEDTGDYELKVLVDSNIIAVVNGIFIINNITSVEEPNTSKLVVYPNPTSDFFEVPETPELKFVEVFNLLGNKVKSFDAASNRQYYIS